MNVVDFMTSLRDQDYLSKLLEYIYYLYRLVVVYNYVSSRFHYESKISGLLVKLSLLEYIN